ncbi:hypothetical protein [Winogradskyella algicola]|uniref:hypothetical protein n=1 Tax=Winogradskyella algicola TaxID=2575815 RepID=UPI001108764A|nr:hypothetical protein [Winogradskyella algicola]
MVKKIFMLGLFATLFMAINCDNEPYEGEIIVEDTSCVEAIEATEIAAQNFLNGTQEDFSDLCLIYKEALLNQIEACGDEDGSLQLLADDLGTCTEEIDACEEAIVATEIALNDFNNTTDNDYEETCNTYKNALMNQIEICGDEDGLLNTLIEDLGDCELTYVETLGTWKLIAWEPNPITDLDLDNDGISSSNFLDEINCYDNETIDFYSDGTGRLYLRSIANITFTPIVGTDMVEFSTVCSEIDQTIFFTWFQDGNTVTFNFLDGTVLYYFRNANRLYVVINDGLVATSSVDNTSTITHSITYIYEKL